MSHYLVAPGGELRGELRVPGDKSISHRALLFGGLARGATNISDLLQSEDCLATLRALRNLGVEVKETGGGSYEVHSRGPEHWHRAAQALDMGNAGTAMRLFMGVLAGQSFDSELIGDASLMQRPMERVAAPLRLMGANIATRDGRPPVHIKGGTELHGIDYTMPMASAQVKSAILLAGLGATGTTRVTEPAITRDHTERMLKAFNVVVEQSGATVSVQGGQRLSGTQIIVPGDFSSAAFFIVAGLLAAGPGGLLLRDVGVNPTRTGLLDILRLMGAKFDVATRQRPEPDADIHVQRTELRGIHVPESLVSLAIDEFPVLFVAAACAEGETIVSGAEELRVKESDRLAVMAEGLTTLGVQCELRADGIRIVGNPERPFTGGRIDSHGDHRIAMAFAVAALRARDEIHIADVANVATSFPGFPHLASSVGMRIEEKS